MFHLNRMDDIAANLDGRPEVTAVLHGGDSRDPTSGKHRRDQLLQGDNGRDYDCRFV